MARPAAPPVSRPAPVVRAAPPHINAAPQHAATPRFNPSRVAAPRHQAPAARIQSTARPNAPTVQRNASPNVSAAQIRSQQRQERTLRRAEDRQLRNLPRSQRAARRLEIQNARQQRAQQRLQATQPNAATTAAQPNTRLRSATRRNGQARITQQAARQGRFAAPFAARASATSASHVAAHRAWRRGLRAAFVPWYGPVFWPYAYSDVFDYAFWPYGYDDGYWAYAYDDFFDGVFWGDYGPPEDYGYAAPPPPRPSYAAVQELCKQPGSGVTAWPFAEIERKVGLNDDQKRLLDDVRKTASDAAASFKASCPAENAFPLTPPGRLAAMTARLDATLQAVQTVRPPLEKFYDSLSDEQKERFNQIGPHKPSSAEAAQASAASQTCKEQKPGLTNLPIERIEDAIKPSDAQEASLNALQDATVKAVSILQAACPDETPLTPPGRLAAMQTRLQAMVEAANTVKPALADFYGSLSNEQKARFNSIGRELSQTSSND
jgi:hypothetical protein